MFIWTGFDYLGEPTPYDWPARSSYFGVVDLAGFPKDPYYMYQSEWTNKPVLHLLPHWNWNRGESIVPDETRRKDRGRSTCLLHDGEGCRVAMLL